MDKTNAKSSKLKFMYGALEEVADEKITLNKEGIYKKEETNKTIITCSDMPINYLRTDSGAFTLVLSNFLRESIMGFQIGYLSTDLKISIKALEDSSKAISSMDYFEKNKQYIF